MACYLISSGVRTACRPNPKREVPSEPLDSARSLQNAHILPCRSGPATDVTRGDGNFGAWLEILPRLIQWQPGVPVILAFGRGALRLTGPGVAIHQP